MRSEFSSDYKKHQNFKNEGYWKGTSDAIIEGIHKANLTPTAKLLCRALHDAVDDYNQGMLYRSNKFWADKIGVSERAVYRAMQEIEREGWGIRHWNESVNGRPMPNTFQVKIPPCVDEIFERMPKRKTIPIKNNFRSNDNIIVKENEPFTHIESIEETLTSKELMLISESSANFGLEQLHEERDKIKYELSIYEGRHTGRLALYDKLSPIEKEIEKIEGPKPQRRSTVKYHEGGFTIGAQNETPKRQSKQLTNHVTQPTHRMPHSNSQLSYVGQETLTPLHGRIIYNCVKKAARKFNYGHKEIQKICLEIVYSITQGALYESRFDLPIIERMYIAMHVVGRGTWTSPPPFYEKAISESNQREDDSRLYLSGSIPDCMKHIFKLDDGQILW